MRTRSVIAATFLASAICAGNPSRANASKEPVPRPSIEGPIIRATEEVDLRLLYRVVPQTERHIAFVRATRLDEVSAMLIRTMSTSTSSDYDELVLVVSNRNGKDGVLKAVILKNMGKNAILIVRQGYYLGLFHADRVYKDFIKSLVGEDFNKAIDDVLKGRKSDATMRVATGIDPELFLDMIERFEPRRVDIRYELTHAQQPDGSIVFGFEFTFRKPAKSRNKH